MCNYVCAYIIYIWLCVRGGLRLRVSLSNPRFTAEVNSEQRMDGPRAASRYRLASSASATAAAADAGCGSASLGRR